jgi:hypothetical protein
MADVEHLLGGLNAGADLELNCAAILAAGARRQKARLREAAGDPGGDPIDIENLPPG